jgi:spermidine synthase
MSKRFEELDWTPTPMGDLMLRRRFDPVAEVDVFEVKLGEDFLMSSLFTVAEIALTTMALDLLPDEPLDVVVGGLGLGYTAATALADARVRSMLVIERLAPVISWHERGLIPAAVPSSQRTRLINDDFFALAAGSGFDTESPDRKFHVVILDIDHSPRHLLSAGHAGFYTPEGTAHLASHLLPEGVFALWSNDPPDEEYLTTLQSVFPDARAEVVEFDNPLQSRTSTNTIYVGRRTDQMPHSR